MKLLKRCYLGVVFFFLYMPIIVLIVLSFNESKSRANFTGFSLRWYEELFQDTAIMESLVTTIIIALVSAAIATVLGTFAALGIRSMKRWKKSLIMNVTYMPVVNPDIVMGVSLLMLFVFFQIETGFVTLLIAHVTFNTPYVILNILPRLDRMDKNLVEAAYDLGAGTLYTLWKVIIPEIMPGILTGFLMAITLSIDDFVVSFFTGGNGVNTLSVTIYNMTKKGIPPKINALSALIMVVVFVLLLIVNMRNFKGTEEDKEKTRI